MAGEILRFAQDDKGGRTNLRPLALRGKLLSLRLAHKEHAGYDDLALAPGCGAL